MTEEEEEPGPKGTCHPSDIPCGHTQLRPMLQDPESKTVECLECHEVFDISDVDDIRRLHEDLPEPKEEG